MACYVCGGIREVSETYFESCPSCWGKGYTESWKQPDNPNTHVYSAPGNVRCTQCNGGRIEKRRRIACTSCPSERIEQSAPQATYKAPQATYKTSGATYSNSGATCHVNTPDQVTHIERKSTKKENQEVFFGLLIWALMGWSVWHYCGSIKQFLFGWFLH